jgi:hypothetical protein
MGGRIQFAPTKTGHPNKICFTGKTYPEHLVLKRDLLDFEDDRKQLWFGGMNNECHCSKDRFVVSWHYKNTLIQRKSSGKTCLRKNKYLFLSYREVKRCFARIL